jgi:hypothetical protein
MFVVCKSRVTDEAYKPALLEYSLKAGLKWYRELF